MKFFSIGKVAGIIALLLLILYPIPRVYSQYHYFGRNKVQYTEFDWHILQTDHFDIYFDPEMEDIAKIGAAAAESSYVDLSKLLDHSLTQRIPLIFYSSHLLFQQTNITPGFIPEGVGGFFEFIKSRVVVPSNGDMYQFRRVIRHELVHVFMTSKINRIFKDAGTLTNPGPPLWFTEGLAEYWSAQTLDPQSKMILRDAVLNNYLVPLTQIYSISGSYLMYKEGENLLHFIADTYGPDKIPLFIENIWRDDDFQKVMEYVLGVPTKKLDEQWRFWLKQEYYPLLDTETLPSPISQQLTRVGVNHSPSIYTKDGRKYIAFVSNRTGYTNIYSKPLNADPEDKLTLLVEGERNQQYESFHFLDSGMAVADSTNRLVFVTKSGERDALHIYDINKQESLNSFTFPDLVGISSPSWNRDGTQIVFSGMMYSGKVDLYLFDLKTEELIRLTGDVYNDQAPVFGPDAQYIYFSSDRTDFGKGGYSNVFRFNLHSGNIEYVTHEQSHDTTPVVSPDGRQLAFISDRGGTNNIWVMDIPESGRFNDTFYTLRPITEFATAALHPTWADDSTLVCTAFDDYQFQLHEIKERPKPSQQISWAFTGHNLWKYPSLSIHNPSTQVKPYKRKYSLDLAMSQVSNDPIFGTSGGGQLAFSDIMGNHRWEVLVYNTAESAGDFWQRFNVLISKYNLENRANWGAGIFHFNNLYWTPREGFYNERRYGGMFMLRYPFSMFRRLEASATLAYSEKDLFGASGPRKALLMANFLSYVKDNTIWGPTGPMDGQRFLVQAGFTNDIRFNNVNYYTLIGDYRQYFRISQRVSYALRLMALRSEGYEPQRFYIGGSWTLRGYPRFRIWGKNVVLWNNELRFPLIDQLGIRFPFGGIGFRQLRGALFFDAGNAWEDKFPGWLGSMGIGFRINLGGFLVLRYDIGRRTDFHSIDKKNFYQFFFGWDY